jgi:chaperonin cofactor prefoldin
MDDDVAQMFRAVNERIKKLETAIKDEKDAREGLEGSFKFTDSQVDAVVKALGAWTRGSLSNKIDDIDKTADDLKKRVDALEKKMKK